MPGDLKQMIQERVIEAAVTAAEKVIEAAVTAALNCLVAKGIPFVRNWIEWVFGARNEAESDWVGKIGEVAEKYEKLFAEFEKELEKELRELMSGIVIDPIAKKKRRRLGGQRMTSTVAELGEIEEEEESHEFCPGAGDPRVVGNESRSVSSKRKERGYYNYNDPMIMPSRGLEEDPQRYCTYKYGDDGRFTFIYSTTATQIKWTYPGIELDLPFTFVSFNGFVGGRTCLKSTLIYTPLKGTMEAVLGTERCKLISIVYDPFLRPYLLTVDAWADSSSGRSTFVFSVIPMPCDFNSLKFCEDAHKIQSSKGDSCIVLRGLRMRSGGAGLVGGRVGFCNRGGWIYVYWAHLDLCGVEWVDDVKYKEL